MSYRRPHKYNVAEAEDRTYDGVQYDSRAEMLRATELDLLIRAGEILGWQRQVLIRLGPDFTTRIDFVVRDKSDVLYGEEVKGMELGAFLNVRRLWPKYGPYRLKILTRVGNRWSTEWLAGRPEPTKEVRGADAVRNN